MASESMAPQQSAESDKADDELRASAAKIIGQIVLAFSSLEFNVGLCLRNLTAGEDVTLLNPMVERLSSKRKLDALQKLITLRFADQAKCVAQFDAWFKKMDELRQIRNWLIHGRWGVLHKQGVVINVAPKMPRRSADNGQEVRYDLPALEAELLKFSDARSAFEQLQRTWNL